MSLVFIAEAIIYDDLNRSGGAFRSKTPISEWDPHPHYERHLGNLKYLEFLHQHPDTSFKEKQQAGKEIEIANRKLKFWRSHPKFDAKRAGDITTKVNKTWDAKKK